MTKNCKNSFRQNTCFFEWWQDQGLFGLIIISDSELQDLHNITKIVDSVVEKVWSSDDKYYTDPVYHVSLLSIHVDELHGQNIEIEQFLGETIKQLNEDLVSIKMAQNNDSDDDIIIPSPNMTVTEAKLLKTVKLKQIWVKVGQRLTYYHI